jgi:general secretion pathway protein F/type IV pilus assembly protein PilC
MAAFHYIALDREGARVEGQLDAGSLGEAFRRLEQERLVPVEVRGDAARPVGGGAKAAAAGAARAPKLKRAAVIAFTEEMADLLDAGLQLPQALGVLAERQENAAIRQVAARVRDGLREGEPLSAALRAASPSFDDLYTNLVAAGEASGSLTEILKRQADSLTLMHDLQKRFIQALAYPAVMVGACALLTVVFIAVLVPQLSDLLAKSGQQLPLVTRGLVATGEFLATYWWVILLGCTLAAAGFKAAVAGAVGRLWWDERKLRLPLAGSVISTRFYAGFCQALGNLVANGVPLLSALRLMVKATPNRFLRGKLEGVVEAVAAGDSFSLSLRRSGAFPVLMADMVAVGEQTGRLGRALNKAARRYDKELDAKIKRLTAMVTPAVIIFLALVVTVIAYSIVTSIFSAVSGIRRG